MALQQERVLLGHRSRSERGSKVRHELTAGDGLVNFAGIWEETPDVPAYASVTCEAVALITHVHDRRPANPGRGRAAAPG